MLSYHSLRLFEEPQNFDAAMGEVCSLSLDDAITRLNQLIVKYPDLLPPLTEKMKFLQTDKNWERAIDIANRILIIDSSCITALQVVK